jgi:hypothetical protein
VAVSAATPPIGLDNSAQVRSNVQFRGLPFDLSKGYLSLDAHRGGPLSPFARLLEFDTEEVT